MKSVLFDISGKKKKDFDLPKIFATKIREDIAAKYFEADKLASPHSPYEEAGRRHSASGTISHKRHDWKGHYGQGKSRIPRKTMSRRGVNFYWIGAEISGTRGGRRAHPPKGIGKEKRINKKEIETALNSGFASTAREEFLIKRYGRLDKMSLKLPVIIESKLDNVKTKDFIKILKSIFGDNFDLVLKKKDIRAGKGKLRNRRYKMNSGLLLIKGNDEKIKMKGIDIRNVNEVAIRDLYPLGRLAVYTEKAMEVLAK